MDRQKTGTDMNRQTEDRNIGRQTNRRHGQTWIDRQVEDRDRHV